MHRFWDNFIVPIIGQMHPAHIVEVGANSGQNTKKILEYSKKYNIHLSVIDPIPGFDVSVFQKEYGECFRIYADLNVNALADIPEIESMRVSSVMVRHIQALDESATKILLGLEDEKW